MEAFPRQNTECPKIHCKAVLHPPKFRCKVFAVNFGTISKNFKQEAKNIQQDKCERGGEEKIPKERR